MKRKLTFILVALMLTASSSVAAADDINLNINGRTVTFDEGGAVIIDSCTMIPLRCVSDLLGYEVDWDPQTKTATLTGSNVLKFTVGSNEYTDDSEIRYSEVPARIVNNRLYLPLRAIGEAAGKTISWNGNTKTAYMCDHYYDGQYEDDWNYHHNQWHRRYDDDQYNNYGNGWGGHHYNHNYCYYN